MDVLSSPPCIIIYFWTLIRALNHLLIAAENWLIEIKIEPIAIFYHRGFYLYLLRKYIENLVGLYKPELNQLKYFRPQNKIIRGRVSSKVFVCQRVIFDSRQRKAINLQGKSIGWSCTPVLVCFVTELRESL